MLVLWIQVIIELSDRFVCAGTPPTVAMNTTYFSWRAGETVILRCYLTSTVDSIDSVFWIFENHQGFRTINPSSNPDKYSGSTKSYPSLIISNLTFADIGKYKCAGRNEFGTGISKTALFLNVTGTPPNVTATKRYYIGETGQNISLSTSIYSAQGDLLSVYWLFHQKRGISQINVSDINKYMGGSVASPSLYILNLTSGDIGNYTCRAVNVYGFGESKQIMLEIIEYLPLAKIEQANYIGNIGRHIVIKCLVSSPHTGTDYVLWIFFDVKSASQEQINANSKYEMWSNASHSLLIKNLSFDDEGKYKCIAFNSFGTGYSNWTSLSVLGIPVIDIGSESYDATYGHPVTLECKVWSQTAIVNIYWERNSGGNIINITSEHAGVTGVTIENPKLTIKVTTSSDSALYICVAENMYGIGKSHPTWLQIKGGIPVVRAHETEVNATYGMTVTLNVVVDSAPAHFQMYWTKVLESSTGIIHNGTIGTTGGSLSNPSLSISFPTVSDVGIYQCHATNVLGIGHSENISLTVNGDVPIVKVGETEITAHFGDTIKINCTIQSFPNYTRVYWEKRNSFDVTHLSPKTKGIRGSTIDTPSLTIIFVTSTDTGYYTCNAENVVGVGKSRALKLVVNAGAPILNIGAFLYETVFGSPVTIDCFVTADPQVRYIFWQKNSNGFFTTITFGAVGTKGISPELPSLTIMFPSKSDQGEYTCFAVNDLGQRGSLPAVLKVTGGLPVVSIGDSIHSSEFGESYSINCKINADPYHTDIYWHHKTDGFIRIIKKDTLGVSGVSLENPTLTIDLITTSDAGTYTCYAENVVGTGKSKDVILKVNGGLPVVDAPLTSYSSRHGDDVALLCTVLAIPQHLNVYWVKETKHGSVVLNHGTTGTIGMTVLNPSLSFNPAATTNSGLYTCLAVNDIGTGASRPISLTVMPEYTEDSSNQGFSNQLIAWIMVAIFAAVLPVCITKILAKVTDIGKPDVSLRIESCNTDNVLIINRNDKVQLICKKRDSSFFNITHCTWYVKKKTYSKNIKLKKEDTTNISYGLIDEQTETVINEERRIHNGFIATINRVKTNDAGTYSCTATNRIRRESSSNTVDLVIQENEDTSNEAQTKHIKKKAKTKKNRNVKKCRKNKSGKIEIPTTSNDNQRFSGDNLVELADIKIQIQGPTSRDTSV